MEGIIEKSAEGVSCGFSAKYRAMMNAEEGANGVNDKVSNEMS